MLIWVDSVCQIISLDWVEGPLEDCITPEWYISATPLLNLNEGFEKIKDVYKFIFWEKKWFSIFTIPSELFDCLHGTVFTKEDQLWILEYRYTNYGDLKTDLNLLLDKIQKMFNGGL